MSLDSPEDAVVFGFTSRSTSLQHFIALEANMTNGKSNGTTKETPKQEKKDAKSDKK